MEAISLCSRSHTPSAPSSASGLLHRTLVCRGAGSGLSLACCSQFHPHLAIAVPSAASARGLLSLNLSAAFSYEELWSEVKYCRPPAYSTLCTSDSTLSTKKEKKNVRLYFLPRFYFYFSGIVNGLCRHSLLPKVMFKILL